MTWFRSGWALLAAFTLQSTSAQVPAPPTPVSPLLSFRQVLDRPERPQPQQRIAYASSAPQQVGELWLPPAERFGPGPYPVVLLVHGGCWMAELPGPELLAWQAEAIRLQGHAVWSISYRRLGHPGGGYPGTFLDVAAGADHLRELAKTQPLDLGRIMASGHSAGGHLALWLAARPQLPTTSPLYRPDPLRMHAVVPVAGVGDLAWAEPSLGAACSPGVLLRLVDHAARDKAAWDDTSPVRLAPLGLPVTMVSAVYDPIVAPAHARRFWQQASLRGETTVRLLTLPDAGHFELIAPWTPAGEATVNAIVGR